MTMASATLHGVPSDQTTLAVASSIVQTWGGGRWNLFFHENDVKDGPRKLAELATQRADESLRSIGRSVADQFALALSNLHLRDKLDEIITKHELRDELIARLNVSGTKKQDWPDKKHGVSPV